jgi:transcriptional regulator with XRE-family HTH domain
MADTRSSSYASRLIKAMDEQGCTVQELAIACSCSEKTIKDARSGRLPMLKTEHNGLAAFYLRVDERWLARGDAVAISKELAEIALAKIPTRYAYDAMPEDQKHALHVLLRRAVEELKQAAKLKVTA